MVTIASGGASSNRMRTYSMKVRSSASLGMRLKSRLASTKLIGCGERRARSVRNTEVTVS
jgi:hypothetical protein